MNLLRTMIPRSTVRGRYREHTHSNKSAFPERKLSRAKGERHRDKILGDLKRWSNQILEDVRAINDSKLQLAVAFMLDALADEDECGRFVLSDVPGTNQLRLDQIELDNDIFQAAIREFGREGLDSARRWFQDWIKENSPPIWWIGWRFERVDIGDVSPRPMQIEADYVVYCFQQRRTIGITLWDGPRLDKTTILTLPRWRAL